jgi:hypothetical protein
MEINTDKHLGGKNRLEVEFILTQSLLEQGNAV